MSVGAGRVERGAWSRERGAGSMEQAAWSEESGKAYFRPDGYR
jgi:hypothetical protein